MSKMLVKALFAFTLCVAAPSAFAQNKQVAATTEDSKLDALFPGTNPAMAMADATKRLLLQKKLWGAAVDTGRPGCGSCGIGGMAFHFFNGTERFLVRVFFHKSREIYNAYLKGQRYPDDLQLKDSYIHHVGIDSAGHFYLPTSHFSYDCRPEANGFKCTRTFTDGWVDRFTLRPLPYNSTDQKIP